MTSPLAKGSKAEKQLISTLLNLGIPADDIFHDLYMDKPNGYFSQIDAVILTKIGIIVVEVKNYGGWIFGNENQTQWIKVLA